MVDKMVQLVARQFYLLSNVFWMVAVSRLLARRF